MLRKKSIVFSVVMAMVVFLSAGCGKGNQESASENTVKIVQVTDIEGTTITADIGELSSEPSNGPEGEPPEMPGGGSTEGGEPPEIPEGGSIEGEAPNGGNVKGEAPNGGNNEGEPPEIPEGGSVEGGEPPEKPGSNFISDGESITFTITESTKITQEFQQGSEEASAEDIVKNSVLEVRLDSKKTAVSIVIKNLHAGGGFGGSTEVVNGSSAAVISEEISVDGESYTSGGDDENALRVDGADVTLKNITVKKIGGNSSNTENGDFYGQNAGLLVLNGSTADIKGGSFQTNAVNGNAVFSYGEGTTVNIEDAKIRTTQNNSGGIQTTGGAAMNAVNLDVQTEGNSAAAVRSDRGGGTVKVTKGKYVTNGTGSPAVYCTAAISIEDAALTANASEGIVVEGKNSVSLKNCDVAGNMENTYHGDADENIHCVMIYQSMSGDAAVGNADFQAEGGSIISKSGDLFYVTNTDCSISLKNVKLTLDNDTFLRVEGNSSSRGWGTKGANGGNVTLSADSQKIEGKILVDSISSLEFSMLNGTEYKGSINSDGGRGDVTVSLDEDSTWMLTGDSYITGFEGDISQVNTNGYRLFVDGKEMK